jgi:hypothetical protein
MRTKPTLTFAASAFIVTAVLFAAAMVVAHSLSIPDPAERFLPSVARDLPSGTDADDVELANDDRIGQAPVADEPMPVVTAVPEPPSTADAGPVPNDEASAVSSSGDTAANAGGISDPLTLSTGGTPSARKPPKKYTGPGWPSWGGNPTPTAPPGREPKPQPSEPQPSESESEEWEGESTEPPSEPVPADEPVPSEPAAPSPEAENEPSEPVASEGASE